MLTSKQHELLMFIDRRLRETGFSPSFDEMKEGMRLKSKSGIHRLIAALEERGFLARRHNRARALEVLRLPENLALGNHSTRAAKTTTAGSGRSTISIGLAGSGANPRPANDTGVVEVPLHGRIAAGPSVEAPHVTGDYITVPAAMLPHGGDQHYALEVVGDSMTGAGIVDGDMVIIRRDTKVENGKVAVVSVDGGATLKRIFRYSDEIELESANVRYPTRAFPFERVTVQGQLVALVRRY
jgi:repressor LexA